MQRINLSRLANTLQAWKSCVASDKKVMAMSHDTAIDLMLEALPHGSGIDNGVKLDREASSNNLLVFHLSFHHMDEQGGYDGWTEHRLSVRPSFIHGYEMYISGKDRNYTKEYLQQVFDGIFYCDPMEPRPANRPEGE